MNGNIRFKTLVLCISLSLSGCFSKTTNECLNDICLNTVLNSNGDSFSVELVFISDIDTALFLRGEALTIGCPFYQEDQVYFEKNKPSISELKFTQIVIENERGNFRVFSSQFIDPEKETIILMPNCAFLDGKELNLRAGQVEKIRFNVREANDLSVEKMDEKIRLHIYYKDNNTKNEGVISSNNWILLK